MKYIDAEKLIAEIETWIDIAEKRINNNAPIEHPETIDEEKLKYLQKTRESKITWLDGQEEALKKVLSIITSLQQEQPDQPDVDLDALVNEAFDKYSSVDGYGQLSVSLNRAELYSFIKKIARKEE